MSATQLGTRAVTCKIRQGINVWCPACGQLVRYRPWKGTEHQIICNVYRRGKWHRVEHWHPDCYTTAAQPHGNPDKENT